MLRNDNVWMSIGHLDHVLTVYSSMEYVTWKSPGPMCGSVGRIPRPDSCMSVSSWSKIPLLCISTMCFSIDHFCLPCPSRWRGSLLQHGLWWLTRELHYSPLLWRLDCTNWMNLFNTILSTVLYVANLYRSYVTLMTSIQWHVTTTCCALQGAATWRI